MSGPSPSNVAAVPRASAPGAADTRPRGRWLAAARLGWLAVALMILVLDVIGTPVLFRLMHMGCDGDQCVNLQPTTEQMSSLLASGLSRTAIAIFITALYWIGTLVYAAIAAAIFWRRSDDRMALFGSFTLLVFGAGPVFGAMKALPTDGTAWIVPVHLVELMGTVSFYLFFCLFPSGHFVPRWMPWVALIQASGEILAPIPYAPLQAVVNGPASFPLLYGVLIFAQIYRYWRVSTPLERQQTKWVVLGFAAGFGAFLAFLGLGAWEQGAVAVQPAPAILFFDAALSAPLWLIPICIAVAITRSRLWDIDILIRRTLVYGALTATLAAVYFTAVLSAQAIVQALTGRADLPPVVVVASTLLIAALFTPLRRRLQTVIDRRFYRRKYDAARTLAAFGATLRTETDLGALRAHLVAAVDETMRPTHVSLWLRASAGSAGQDRLPRGAQP